MPHIVYNKHLDAIEWDEKNKRLIFQPNEQFTLKEKIVLMYIETLLRFLENELKISATDLVKDSREFLVEQKKRQIVQAQCVIFSIIHIHFNDYTELVELVFDGPVRAWHRFRMKHTKEYGEGGEYTRLYNTVFAHISSDNNFLNNVQECTAEDDSLASICADERFYLFANLSFSESARIITEVITDVCDVDLTRHKIGAPGDSQNRGIGMYRKMFIACMYMIYGKKITDKDIALFLAVESHILTASKHFHVYRKFHREIITGARGDFHGYVNSFEMIIQRLSSIAESQQGLKPAQS